MSERERRWERLLRATSIGLWSGALLLTVLFGLAWRRAQRVERAKPYAAISNPPYSVIRFIFERDGRSTLVVQKTNRWGMLGDDPPQDWERHYTILAVGGSSTHGLVMSYGRDWPARLQAALRRRRPRVWVGNLGIPGHTSVGHRRTLEEFALRLRPDAVLFMMGGNDLYADLGSRWRGRYHHVPEGWRYRYLFYRSRLMQAWIDIRDALLELDGSAPPRNVGDAVRFVKTGLPAAGVLPDDTAPGELLEGLARYRDNVRELARLSRERGVRPVFMTQPLLFGDDAEWAKVAGQMGLRKNGRAVLSGRLVARMMKAYNQATLDVCAREKLDCFDLASRVPHDMEHFFDAIHLTDKGSARVAAEASAYLLGLIPPQR